MRIKARVAVLGDAVFINQFLKISIRVAVEHFTATANKIAANKYLRNRFHCGLRLERR